MKMGHEFSWQYDEFKQIGSDYSSEADVEVYDSSHADFRDIEAESIKILDSLENKSCHRKEAAARGYRKAFQ